MTRIGRVRRTSTSDSSRCCVHDVCAVCDDTGSRNEPSTSSSSSTSSSVYVVDHCSYTINVLTYLLILLVTTLIGLYYSSHHYPHDTHFSNFSGFLSNGGYSLSWLPLYTKSYTPVLRHIGQPLNLPQASQRTKDRTKCCKKRQTSPPVPPPGELDAYALSLILAHSLYFVK